MTAQYDITVIGSGPGGYRAAILGALRGQRVAIVEKADWGGCCLNRGCVPKKTWHATAQLVAASSDLAARGIQGTLSGDLDTAWTHQESVVAEVQDSYVNYMKRLGVSALRGNARLTGPHTIVISGEDGEQSIESAHIVLATGSAPHIPAGVTPTPDRILTTDMLFDAPPPPGRRVAVIGGGIIGTEFAFILTQLGCQVSWITGSAPLARTRFSPQALNTLKSALQRHGIAPHAGGRLAGAEVVSAANGEEEVCVHLDDGGEVRVDWLVLGTGRIPYTEGLGLDSAGVNTDERGFIVRNTFLQTSAPHIYAIGDCTSPQMTANQALADATLAIGNILAGEGEKQAQEPDWVPEAVYSAVELARVGLDDDTAEDEGFEPAVGFAAFETSPRALGQQDTEGFVRLLADMDSGTLLGGEIVGSEAAELIHLLSTAPDRNTALKWLARGRYNHPARAEELLNASETMASKWGLSEFLFE